MPIQGSDAYRLAYLNGLRSNVNVSAYNLEQNQIFQQSGNVEGAYADTASEALTSKAEKKAFLMQNLQREIKVEELGTCLNRMPDGMIDYAAANLDSIKQDIQFMYGDKIPIGCAEFTLMIDQLVSASTLAATADEITAMDAVTQADMQSGTRVPMRGGGAPKPAQSEGISGGGRKTLVAPGAKEAYRFKEFGRYVIDLEKLRNNELQVKYRNGKRVQRVAPRILGGGLSGIILNVSNGQRPKPEDYAKLTADEKDYLDMVRRETRVVGLEDLTSVARTSRNKDRHDFELMKGQILAGNDNPQLVKKFKVLLVRLRRGGQVPTKEANEILMDLAAMGI